MPGVAVVLIALTSGAVAVAHAALSPVQAELSPFVVPMTLRRPRCSDDAAAEYANRRKLDAMKRE
jgi:hypothetical protein